MKKIISFFLVSMFLLTGVLATEPSSSPYISEITYGNIQTPEQNEEIGLWISGGTFEKTELFRGEAVNALVFTRFQYDAESSAFALFWDLAENPITEGKSGFPIRTSKSFYGVSDTFNINLQSKKGDYISVKVVGIPTNDLPTTWCNKLLKIKGIHYVKEAGKSSPTIDQYGWLMGQILNNKVLLRCTTVPTTCTAKTIAERVCDGLNIVKRVQLSYLYEGKCKLSDNIVQVCTYGCSVGATSCNDPNQATKKKNGDLCIINGQEEDNICESGKCIAGRCGDNLIETGGDCVNTNDCTTGSCEGNKCVADTRNECEKINMIQCTDGTCKTDCTVTECTENLLCEDGISILQECVDGKYNEANFNNCEQPETPGTDCTEDLKCEDGENTLQKCEDGKYGEINFNNCESAPDLCKDVKCEDECELGILYADGTCINGVCTYSDVVKNYKKCEGDNLIKDYTWLYVLIGIIFISVILVFVFKKKPKRRR